MLEPKTNRLCFKGISVFTMLLIVLGFVFICLFVLWFQKTVEAPTYFKLFQMSSGIPDIYQELAEKRQTWQNMLILLG